MRGPACLWAERVSSHRRLGSGRGGRVGGVPAGGGQGAAFAGAGGEGGDLRGGEGRGSRLTVPTSFLSTSISLRTETAETVVRKLVTGRPQGLATQPSAHHSAKSQGHRQGLRYLCAFLDLLGNLPPKHRQKGGMHGPPCSYHAQCQRPRVGMKGWRVPRRVYATVSTDATTGDSKGRSATSWFLCFPVFRCSPTFTKKNSTSLALSL